MSALEQKIREGYKQTEVGFIPIDWDLTDVDSLVSSKILDKPLDGNHGDIHPKGSDFVSDGIPFIMANNIQNGQIRFDKCSHITKEQADSLLKGFAIEGDVLLTHKATIGNTAVIGKIQTEYLMLTPQVTYYRVLNYEKLNNQYLRHFMDGELFQTELLAASGGGTRAYIGITAQRELPIILPSINEQTAIANALSDVDALLTELEELIAKKQAIKTATIQQLLTGKTRLPQFATYTEGEKQGQQKGTKPSELGEIPEDWDVVSLGDVITFKNGAAHEDCIDEYGNFVLVNSKFISTEGKVRKGTNECRQATIKNDLLMVMSDVPNGKAIAKCFLVDEDHLYTVNQRICILRPNEQVNPAFLLKIVSRNPYYLAFDDGAKQTNLRREDVLNCPIVNPSFEEQTAIATILSDMDNEIQTLEQRLAKTRQIKQGMMQELLTGRTRLPFDKD